MNNVRKKERLSNIELLRLLAMFLVLVLHADFFSLGWVTREETLATPASAFCRFFFESLSIICVNVFVLISGWFGIRPSVKSFCNFIFQCLFFYVGIYAVMSATGSIDFTVKGLVGCFIIPWWNWFIGAYIGLYILAPVLNTFVDNAEEKTFRWVLLGFFVFQTTFGWWFESTGYFAKGYSTLSFIGLYLLARYVKIHQLNRLEITPPFIICWRIA